MENEGYFPIAGVVIGDISRMIRACKILWDFGILITPAIYPAVPLNRNLLRFSMTAVNTPEEVDRALAGLEAVRRQVFGSETA